MVPSWYTSTRERTWPRSPSSPVPPAATSPRRNSRRANSWLGRSRYVVTISRSSERTDSPRPFPSALVNRDRVPVLAGVVGHEQLSGRTPGGPCRRHSDMVPGGSDDQQVVLAGSDAQQLLTGGAERFGKFDIGPSRPAVVGVCESDVAAVGRGADPDPARAGLVDRQRRRRVVRNAQRPDRPGRPCRRREAGTVRRDRCRTGRGGGRETAPTLARRRSAWSAGPATSRRPGDRSPSRSAMPAGAEGASLRERRRRRCHEVSVVER